MRRRKRELSPEEQAVNNAARAAGLEVSSFSLYGERLYYIRDLQGNLLSGGWSMDGDEALQFISRQERTAAPEVRR